MANNNQEEPHLEQQNSDHDLEGVDEHINQMNKDQPSFPEDDSEKAEIDYGLSAVAQNPKKNIIVMVVVVLIVGGLAYYFLFDTSAKKQSTPSSTDIPTNIADNSNIAVPSIPSGQISPPAPSIQDQETSSKKDNSKKKKKSDNQTITPKPSIPPAPQQTSVNQPYNDFQRQAELRQALQLKLRDQQQAQKREEQRIKSGIMVKQGGGTDNSNKNQANILAAQGKFIPGETSATQQQITRVGNMSSLIAQGKIIDGVLESSAISTYPGPVRALVTRDVYSEKGENVLIPKGSRLIGTFASGYTAGQNRVMITWNRLIMPNGYDIAVDSPSAGPEGILGVEGKVHTEIAQTLTNSVLVSALNIAFADIAQSLTNTKSSQTTTTVDTSGNQTTTSNSNPTQNAINQAAQNFGQTIQSYVQQNFIVKPYISIPHGTRIKILVNKDLLFPNNLANGVNIIK